MKTFLARWSRHLKLALLPAVGLVLFQNCGGMAFKVDEAQQALAGSAFCDDATNSGTAACVGGLSQCTFNGQVLGVGQTVTAYLASNGTCTAEQRTCQSNGALSGSFNYATCSATGPASCLWNGQTISDGTSVTGYLTSTPDASGQCVQQTRVCSNGMMTGTYGYADCSQSQLASCLFDGRTIPHGGTVTAFPLASVPVGMSCTAQVRICLNGALTGAGDYGSCTVASTSSCSFNGQTIADGQSVPAYDASTVAFGQTCAPVTRVCSGGVLSGTASFASCSVDQPASCLVNGQTIPHGGSITLYAAPASQLGQSCQAEVRTCNDGTLSGSATFASCFTRKQFISADYVPPTGKEGISDTHYDDADALLATRYQKFSQMGIGYKEYNYFWSMIEPGTVTPSATPVTCPADQFMVPANETEKTLWGFHHYRCVSSATVAKFDRMLSRDASIGAQSGIVFWSAPSIYRYPNCLGSPWAGSTLYDGCVPRDDAMDDYEDAINFLANRYNGRNGYGKISHFIVWNENASAIWFDYSPVVATRGVPSVADQSKWVSKYADMVARAHSAIQRNTAGVMLDVSTDNAWLPPRVATKDPAHIGEKTLIDGLWQALGTKYSWSVAVHPYGDLDAVPKAGFYSFLNVQDLVGGYQMSKLQSLGLAPTSLQYPQAYLIASEQGWPQSEGIARQAKFICWAQAITLQDGLVLAQAHNYFQSVEPQEASGGSSGQGAFFGLLPYVSAADLSDMGNYATGAAYLATSPAVWGKNSANYCCQSAGVGCNAPAGTTAVYRSLSAATSTTTAHHFFSTILSEGLRAGMKFEMTAFNLYTAAGDDLAALYRCNTGTGDYILTRDPNCEGKVVEGIIGYVHASPQAGLVPLYRRFSTINADHLATLTNGEGGNAYVTESVLGYVPAP